MVHHALIALIACMSLLSAVAVAQDVLVDSPAAARQAVTAAATSGDGAPAAPVQGLKRNSLQRARAALAKAAPSWNTINTDQDASAAAAVGPAAICGTNSLQLSSSNVACRIISSWSDGSATTCSASKIANRYLATAGHCVHSPGRSRPWATAIDVYCTGQNVCGVSRTTTATNISTTPGWSGGDGNPNAFDIAVVKVASNLPGAAFVPAQLNIAPSGFKATLTGFPSANPESRQCNVAAFSNACRQYTSTGNLAANTYAVGGATMWLSGELDLCKGHSGSAVRDASTPANVIGIVSGGTEGDTGSCFNVFARSMLRANVNAKSCQGATGGASLFCLASKIP